MKKLILTLLTLLIIHSSFAQRLIRSNSKFYIESQNLPEKVEPLLSDKWNQYNAPFYNMCPIDTVKNKRSVVGCVGMAMAQVINYWKWPNTYDWNNIIPVYNEGQYTEVQANAVASLCYDCASSVKTNFSASASGARSIYQASALANIFNYDKGVQMYYRDFYSLSEMILMIKKDLANGRPVLISAYNTTTGHAFVLDGYDENDNFHVCWGNPEHDDDNYTSLPLMVPDQPQWYNPDSPENGLNILQMFTLGIIPNNHPDATGIKRHLFSLQDICPLTKDNTSSYLRDKVDIIVNELCNIGWDKLNDSISIMLRKDDKNVCPLYTYKRDFLLEEIEDTTYTDTLSLEFPKDLTDGVYTIVPMFRDNALDGGKEWVEARTCVGTPNYLIATLNGNKVTLSTDSKESSYLSVIDISFPDMLINHKDPEFEIKLKNNGSEMVGRLYIQLESLDGGKDFYFQCQGITIGKDEEYSVSYSKSRLSAPKSGIYRLHLKYEKNLFADELIDLKLPQDIIVTVIDVNNIQIAMR